MKTTTQTKQTRKELREQQVEETRQKMERIHEAIGMATNRWM